MDKDLKHMDFLFGGNAIFIEELYNLYLLDQTAVDKEWQIFFQNIADINKYQINKTIAQVISPVQEKKEIAAFVESSDRADNYKAKAMIATYRKYAHFLVKLDPLNLEIVKTKSQLGLNIEDFGFTKQQLTEPIEIDDNFLKIKLPSLSKLVDLLDQAYGYDIAIEFDHIEDISEKIWLAERMEDRKLNFMATSYDRKDILKDLVEIEGFEQYLHTKFPGAKRFSIEGGEATIISMDKAIDMSAICGASEIVIGMAHRGRITTLTKVMRKPYREVIAGFITGSILPDNIGISGDVKYHIGYSSDRMLGESNIHLSLAYNPSHLEAINPVVAGKVRAKQDNIGDITRKKVMGILVHGDSAFCGQGVVAESLSMAKLKPYDIGGIIHLVINNQLGFTANNCDTRTSRYSTEFAKIINAPILHVNGDNIEAVLTATDIAVNYRHKFAKDIIIEIVCYRKYGHNEGDEPLYTQPVMYNAIKNKQSPVDIYAASLMKNGLIDEQYFLELKEQFRSKLDQEYELAKKYQPQAQFLENLWSGYSRINNKISATGVKKDILKELGIKLCQIPKDFALNPKLAKLFEIRAKTLQQDQVIDWATAEQLAFASLLNSGTKIRFTGQDVGRGTFSHRHAVLHSQIDDKIYIPLNNLSPNQANFEIADSNLSEYAVLGFEYGYSLVDPKNLVIWEAQFGDFANGAQIIFDQFIASSESKWLRMSGIVVLLPHGFEGQGPEHSSARIERFLQLAAENNIRVTYPTTPASLFHLLRRQIYSNIRIPLIVMSPKSLLRHKMVVSNLSELDVNTSFIPVIDEINKAIKAKNVTRVILCSGKVYYDLLEKREEKNILDVAIIRLEQLYPFENNLIIKILANYNKAEEFIWCQEEPKNMGAWGYIKDKLNQVLKAAKISKQIKYVGRNEAASPATGSLHIHNEQQLKLVEEAIFNINLGE